MSELTPAFRPSRADEGEVVTGHQERLRVLCADGVPHYFFGQDVSTFKSLEVALEWADEFAAKPGIGQACGPHYLGGLRHV